MDLVGGSDGHFRFGHRIGYREDLTLVNRSGQKLQCSHFYPVDVLPMGEGWPCVIYCHCNSGSRRDSEEALFSLLPNNISVFALDFAGSGLSDGDWVSLGAREVDDLEVVVNHLRSTGKVSTLGLWGRSMGAVTALLYSSRDPSVAGMVLDSPFSKLTDLMWELVTTQKLPVPIPRFLLKYALGMMRRSVRNRASFDINNVSPIEIVPESHIPALFGHANEDTFINKTHSELLYKAYSGEDKNMISFSGDHNSPRPSFFYDSATIFLHNVLRLDEVTFAKAATSLVREPSAAQRTDQSANESTQPQDQENGRLEKLQSRGETNVPWAFSDWEVVDVDKEFFDLAEQSQLDAAIEASLREANMIAEDLEQQANMPTNGDQQTEVKCTSSNKINSNKQLELDILRQVIEESLQEKGVHLEQEEKQQQQLQLQSIDLEGDAYLQEVEQIAQALFQDSCEDVGLDQIDQHTAQPFGDSYLVQQQHSSKDEQAGNNRQHVLSSQQCKITDVVKPDEQQPCNVDHQSNSQGGDSCNVRHSSFPGDEIAAQSRPLLTIENYDEDNLQCPELKNDVVGQSSQQQAMVGVLSDFNDNPQATNFTSSKKKPCELEELSNNTNRSQGSIVQNELQGFYNVTNDKI